MNKTSLMISHIHKFAAKQRGIFFTSDLKKFFKAYDDSHLSKKIMSLLHEKIIFRFMRGVYITKDHDLRYLSKRICPNSVISFSTILSDELIIGSTPKKTVYALKVGKSRKYNSEWGSIIHCGVSLNNKHLLEVGRYHKDGLTFADNEKAFLDVLYFYLLGYRFHFDIYSDIDFMRLNKNKMTKYLKSYNNPKFVSFVEGVINGSD